MPTSLIAALLIVVLPTLLVGAYYNFVATDRYVSTAQMTVRSADSAGGSGGKPAYGGWFDDVGNFSSTVDERAASTSTFASASAAVEVS